MKKYLNNLKQLLEIDSPTGYSYDAINYVENAFNELMIDTVRTNKGALIATIKGKDDENQITFSAHVDTLGAMVKEIKDNGRLKLCQIGGYSWNTVEGEYVRIYASSGKVYTGTVLSTKASSHVHGTETSTTERNADTLEVRIDELTSSKDETVSLGISVGDFVCYDTRTVITDSGYVKSRHLDDKACVICLLETARKLVKNKTAPKHTINFFISNYEEVGHGSATGIPENTKYFIAVDMAAPGTGQTSDERKVTICAKDSSGPYDYEVRKILENAAKTKDIPYAIDIYPYYGSDASCALRSGHDIKAGLIGPGVDASHSYERTHMQAIDATIALSLEFIDKI